MDVADSKGVDGMINQHNAGWSFENISSGFDEHILRSIPMYQEGHALICYYSDFFLKPDSVVYDIGCSTGTMLAQLARRHPHKQELSLIGVDSVTDMIGRATQLAQLDGRLSFLRADALDLEFKRCDMVIANYTIQFLPPRVRQSLIDALYRALNWGGAFFMFEKVRAPDGRFQDYASQA